MVGLTHVVNGAFLWEYWHQSTRARPVASGGITVAIRGSPEDGAECVR
jgi:hypothetical protein